MSKDDSNLYAYGFSKLDQDSQSTKELENKLIDGDYKDIQRHKMDDDRTLLYIPGLMRLDFQDNDDDNRVFCRVRWIDSENKRDLIEICQFTVDKGGSIILDSDELVWPFILDTRS